jgi:hypothetical protein
MGTEHNDYIAGVTDSVPPWPVPRTAEAEKEEGEEYLRVGMKRRCFTVVVNEVTNKGEAGIKEWGGRYQVRADVRSEGGPERVRASIFFAIDDPFNLPRVGEALVVDVYPFRREDTLPAEEG